MTRTLALTFALAISPAALPVAASAQNAPPPALEAAPQVLAGSAAAPVTLRLPPGVAPPPNARIGIFMAGTLAKVAELSKPFAASPNGMQATFTLDAEPGLYDIRLLRNDKSRAPLTQDATVAVAGIDREPGWWLFNGSPILAPSAAPSPGAPLFRPGLKRSPNKGDKARTANTRAASPVGWCALTFPPLKTWMDDAAKARAEAIAALQKAREAGENGFVGCVLPASSGASEARDLGQAPPEDIVRGVQTARAACLAIAPEAAFLFGVRDLPPAVAARLLDLAAPECDAVWLDGFVSSDPASLWPLKVARRVAEEQLEFDLPIFVSPRDAASAAEALMSGATAIVPSQAPDPGSQVLAGDLGSLKRAFEANLGLFVGSVTLEDSGLLRAGDALSLFRRMRDIGRVPLLARTYDTAGRRDRSGRDGRRTAEPFALRWTRGTPPQELLTAMRDAAKDGSRAYFEGSPFAQESAPGFDAAAWRELFQANVKPLGEDPPASTSTNAPSASDYAAEDDEPSAVPSSKSSVLKMDDVWTFGVAKGQSVPVEQSVLVTPSRTPTPVELGDAVPPKGESRSDREKLRPAPRVAATLGDGSAGLLISPASGSVRRDPAGDALPRGEVVWAPQLPLDAASASPVEAARLADYDAAVATLLQPALVRLFDRAAASGGEAPVEELPMARGVRVCVRASSKGTLLLGLVNPSATPRSLTVQAQAAGGYAVDLATNRLFTARTRALRVLVDVDVPPRGFRLIAIAKDATAFAEDRDARKLKVRAR